MQNIGGAIRYYIGTLQPLTNLPLISITGTLLGLAIFGILLSISLSCEAVDEEDEMEELSRQEFVVTLLIPILSYAILWFFVFPHLAEAVLWLLTVFFSAIAVVFLLNAIYKAPRHQFSGLRMDPGFLISACLLFIVSTSLLVMEYMVQSLNWIYSENIRIAAYFLLGFSLEAPFLRRHGFSRKNTYLILISLSALTYLPFTATIAIEVAALQGAVYRYLPASIVIHLGAGFLSVLMAALLYSQSRRSNVRRDQILVLLYLLWATVALVTVFRLMSFTFLGEPIIPAVAASLLTIPLLLILARESRPLYSESKAITRGKFLILGVVLISTVILSEFINQALLITRPEFIGTTYGETILLISNLLIMIFYSASVFRIAERAAGNLNVEMYAVGFLSTWLVPNILKSYYIAWTMGWWVSEIIIFTGQLLGPALLSLLYIKTLNKAEESHSRAELYADLLMHDVSNYHQMLLTAIELLDDESCPQDQKNRLARDARNVISLAEQLVTNVRLIGQTEESGLKNIEPVNLVSLLVQSLDDVMEGIGDQTAQVQYRPDVRDAMVLANDLLNHVMLNILYYAFQQAAGTPTIKIDIIGHGAGGESFWQVRFRVPNLIAEQVPIAVEKREASQYEGGLLSLLTARIIVEALGGRMRIHSVGEKGEAPETEFNVTLPALEE
jgi:hypothetical protein